LGTHTTGDTDNEIQKGLWMRLQDFSKK
jgi:hypothetical protein